KGEGRRAKGEGQFWGYLILKQAFFQFERLCMTVFMLLFWRRVVSILTPVVAVLWGAVSPGCLVDER
ncbi:MAG: hypothetical protein KDH97_04570, partial [Calditrichaeota bacterium]|nr:hypothetical protein [Calditrichota bacterium]